MSYITMSMPVNGIVITFLVLLAMTTGKPDLLLMAGGTEAKLGDFPFLVTLTISSNNKKRYCSGSIIHPDWILTAGHCTKDKITVHAGLTQIGSNDSKVQVRNAEKYYTYPGFVNPWNLLGINLIYDFGLIKLDKSLDINNETVKVLELDDSDWEEGFGRICTAVGFGQTPEIPEPDKLYFMETLAFWGPGACPCATKKGKIHASICFISRYDLKTICPGDSGGPLIWDGRLVGVASYDYPSSRCNLLSTKKTQLGCGIEGTVSVYTYVTPILDWIRMYVGDTIP
ncbi:trypsin 3A1 [Halyomorpha halys]|uniref:trypsin 3A1 n=1 Tax=Halyomorpha halys TaxID=286706 RepID=UPI0006D51C11|nr:trypsin 3A1-like [Halyomorpha halys]